MSDIREYFDSLRGKRIAVIGMGVSNTPLIRMLLRAELNKQNKEKAHLHHSSPRNDTDVFILLIIFMRD